MARELANEIVYPNPQERINLQGSIPGIPFVFALADCTISEIERPQDSVHAANFFRGDKKKFFVNTILVTAADGTILHVETGNFGRRADLSVLRASELLNPANGYLNFKLIFHIADSLLIDPATTSNQSVNLPLQLR
jgi:hypothetical protein